MVNYSSTHIDLNMPTTPKDLVCISLKTTSFDYNQGAIQEVSFVSFNKGKVEKPITVNIVETEKGLEVFYKTIEQLIKKDKILVMHDYKRTWGYIDKTLNEFQSDLSKSAKILTVEELINRLPDNFESAQIEGIKNVLGVQEASTKIKVNSLADLVLLYFDSFSDKALVEKTVSLVDYYNKNNGNNIKITKSGVIKLMDKYKDKIMSLDYSKEGDSLDVVDFKYTISSNLVDYLQHGVDYDVQITATEYQNIMDRVADKIGEQYSYGVSHTLVRKNFNKESYDLAKYDEVVLGVSGGVEDFITKESHRIIKNRLNKEDLLEFEAETIKSLLDELQFRGLETTKEELISIIPETVSRIVSEPKKATKKIDYLARLEYVMSTIIRENRANDLSNLIDNYNVRDIRQVVQPNYKVDKKPSDYALMHYEKQTLERFLNSVPDSYLFKFNSDNLNTLKIYLANFRYKYTDRVLVQEVLPKFIKHYFAEYRINNSNITKAKNLSRRFEEVMPLISNYDFGNFEVTLEPLRFGNLCSIRIKAKDTGKIIEYAPDGIYNISPEDKMYHHVSLANAGDMPYSTINNEKLPFYLSRLGNKPMTKEQLKLFTILFGVVTDSRRLLSVLDNLLTNKGRN